MWPQVMVGAHGQWLNVIIKLKNGHFELQKFNRHDECHLKLSNIESKYLDNQTWFCFLNRYTGSRRMPSKF